MGEQGGQESRQPEADQPLDEDSVSTMVQTSCTGRLGDWETGRLTGDGEDGCGSLENSLEGGDNVGGLGWDWDRRQPWELTGFNMVLGKVFRRVKSGLLEVDLVDVRGKSHTQEGADGNDRGKSLHVEGYLRGTSLKI